ncbi:FimD/PapC N-terminal domain-containing protein, partial [Enterobacter ludwigii]|uniref:FimD/PapC N-terminal domain-containing protein n=1 Tax=Enterobacter ludwigii TaxID=299767 RepID=UPI003F729F99
MKFRESNSRYRLGRLRRDPGPLSACTVAVVLSLYAGAASATSAANNDDEKAIAFDDDFLSMSDSGKNKSHVDLSYFSHRGGMMPGDYPVQIRVNGKRVDDG